MTKGIFVYCRPGFEADCEFECQGLLKNKRIKHTFQSIKNSGFILIECFEASTALTLLSTYSVEQCIFPRQWFLSDLILHSLPPPDRVSPLMVIFKHLGRVFKDVYLETLDTNEGKSLSKLCRGVDKVLHTRLQQQDLIDENTSPWRGHICFVKGDAAYVGFSHHTHSAPWPMGIPRLRASREAPSRSALKLEEAFLRLLTTAERQKYLRPGMRAVDLGAAPGGWTWYLTKQGFSVTAIDNGPLQKNVLDSGKVEHLRVDGFKYRVRKPVDWLVCDMVEQPGRIAALMALWLQQNMCRHALFNLKLPMKKRAQEVQGILDGMGLNLRKEGEFKIRVKQLYHDRDEVTVLIIRGK